MTGRHVMSISYATEGTLSYGNGLAASRGTQGTFRLGDVFSKSFAVYGRHFTAFIVLTVFANIPNYLFGWGVAAPPDSPPSIRLFNFSFEGWDLLAVPLGIVCGTIANGAMTYGVVQDLRGVPVSIGESLIFAARRFLPMIGVAITSGVLIWLGFILLVVPGFTVLCMYYVAAPVCVAEKAGVGASLSRSRFLTKGHRWAIFGAYMLIFVLGAISAGIATGATSTVGETGAMVVGYAVQAIFGAFVAVLAAVLYYQLRVAKEGIDLAKIASVFE
jgi:tryptophan-rich sensory protein